jgi:hypothetical protein
MKARRLYSSPNGDRWYLVRDASGAVFIRHEANAASGAHVTHIEMADFLGSGGRGPEHQELLRLIGTLLDEAPGRETRPGHDPESEAQNS